MSQFFPSFRRKLRKCKKKFLRIFFFDLENPNLHTNLDVCVYFGPLVASITSIAIYFLTDEITQNFGASLTATIFMAIIPGYVSTSTAGKFGDESLVPLIVITLLTCWLKAVNSGSIFWSVISSLTYFYAAATWTDFVLFSNMIPIYVLTLIFLGRFSPKLYIAYTTHFLIGSV